MCSHLWCSPTYVVGLVGKKLAVSPSRPLEDVMWVSAGVGWVKLEGEHLCGAQKWRRQICPRLAQIDIRNWGSQ